MQEWIPMRVGIARDPRVVRIARACNLDPFSAVGRLHEVWVWAGEYSTDGTLTSDVQMVDRVAERPGFSSAMIEVGWLIVRGDTLQFPDWQRFNSKCAKARLLSAQRKNVSRSCHKNVTLRAGQKRDQKEKEKEKDKKKATPSSSPSSGSGPKGESGASAGRNGQTGGDGGETLSLLRGLKITPGKQRALAHASPAMVQEAIRDAETRSRGIAAKDGCAAAAAFDKSGWVVRYLEARVGAQP